MPRLAHIGSKGIPSLGGTERVVQALSTRQAADVDVTVYGSSRVCNSGDFEGVRVRAMWCPRLKHIGPVWLQTCAALHAVVRGDFDLVHVHGSENGFIVPLLRLRYPVVTTSHGPAYAREKWGAVARWLIKSLEGLSVRAATVATSVSSCQALSLAHEYGRDVGYVPNGIDGACEVDDDGAKRILDELNLSASEYIMFAAARVDPTKGCLTLLRAVRSLPVPPCVLVVGDLWHSRSHEAELREAAEGLRVRFLPRLDDKRVLMGLVQKARLFVFPSLVEAMSMMLLDVVAQGVPCLASDIPENTDILPDGFPVFRSGDWRDLAERIAAILQGDESEERSLAERYAREVRPRYSWDLLEAEYRAVYARAVKDWPQSRSWEERCA